MVSAKEKAQQIINENGVVVFSKSYCPYCKATKSLLDEKNAKYELLELDQICKSIVLRSQTHSNDSLADGSALQDALEEITGQRSVPNIFIKQQHIGGNSDLQAKKSQLDSLLQGAGAI